MNEKELGTVIATAFVASKLVKALKAEEGVTLTAEEVGAVVEVLRLLAARSR